MFRRKPVSPCPDLFPSAPSIEEIEQDLDAAPVDDVVFLTQVPKDDGDDFELVERFQHLKPKVHH